MKKRYGSLLFVVLSVMILSACGSEADNSDTGGQTVTNPQEDMGQDNTPKKTPEPSLEDDTQAAMQETTDSNEDSGGVPVQGMVIEAGGQKFTVTLYDNETVSALMERLPMTLNMEELNGNEKFYYLDEGLPANSEAVGSIHTGDIMLFGSDCLVLFFEDFSTSYSYTRIGHIEDAVNFADTLAGGTVEVTFETGEQEEKE